MNITEFYRTIKNLEGKFSGTENYLDLLIEMLESTKEIVGYEELRRYKERLLKTGLIEDKTKYYLATID